MKVPLEEQEGVDPVVEHKCAECGATLTRSEMEAALETGGPYLCTIHANDEFALDEDAATPG